MILYARPRVFSLDDSGCKIGIPLKRRNKNHLNSMYFGTLAIGADLASGLLAMDRIKKSPYSLSLVFKDVQGSFFKRIDHDAVFECHETEKIDSLIEEVHKTGERQHAAIKVQVFAPDKYVDELLAEYVLTLSLKERQG